jgi:tetratricopeptide (TPR) repeat protein
VDWVKRAYAMLGEAQLELKQTEEAAKTFDALARIYPDAGNLGSVSVATLEVAKGNFASAGERLAPIIAEAGAVKMADTAKSATYGKAYLLMGRVRESEGRYPEALENYLRTVAVFYADAAAVSEARSRADSLAKEKNVIAP